MDEDFSANPEQAAPYIDALKAAATFMNKLATERDTLRRALQEARVHLVMEGYAADPEKPYAIIKQIDTALSFGAETGNALAKKYA